MPLLSHFIVSGMLAVMGAWAPMAHSQDSDVSPFGDDVDRGRPISEPSPVTSDGSWPVLVTFEAPIREGQEGAVRNLVARMVDFSQADEAETVLYRVFIREDDRVLTFIEAYANSDAMRFHDQRFIQHFADEMGALTQGGRLCIYGEVSDVYKAFAAENGLEVEYFKSLSGFQR
tara:strand:+ start:187 stop:708 length:522 start_codon:yes stop_codon:yes gene_type:complete